jgi:NAD(P)H-hydrate epimerase
MASHRYHLVGLNAVHPEIMSAAIDDPTKVVDYLQKATVVVLGPGLGRSEWSQQVFNLVIQTNKPILIDADGLFFLKPQPGKVNDWVITPHPGEASWLLQQQIPSTPEHRINAIKELIREYNCTVVLKGEGSLIGSPDSKIHISTHGNPGMASGGMGDLLSGVIAGLMAQGMSTESAAKLGVCVHAMAGDKAAMDDGLHGLVATDLLTAIRNLLG